MNAVERQIDLGSYSLYARTQGEGTPAVVFESGMGDDSSIWHLVEPEVALITSTIIYDRAGLGRSGSATDQRRLDSMIDDLEKVLLAIAVKPPYILVGHSLGGLLIRLFAARHPEQIAGLILVDAPHEQQTEAAKAVVSAKTWSLLQAMWSQSHEQINLAAEMLRIGTIQQLPSIPVIVLVATVAPSFPPEFPQDVAEEMERVRKTVFATYQEQLAATSEHGQLIKVEGADHYIQLKRPEVVLEAIRSLIRQKLH